MLSVRAGAQPKRQRRCMGHATAQLNSQLRHSLLRSRRSGCSGMQTAGCVAQRGTALAALHRSSCQNRLRPPAGVSSQPGLQTVLGTQQAGRQPASSQQRCRRAPRGLTGRRGILRRPRQRLRSG